MSQGSGVFHAIWRYGRWVLLVAVLLYVVLLVAGLYDLNKKKNTADAVAFIQSRHLTMDDVDGKHLPPPPDPKLVDATVEGIDANGNGIRDDVELAIFAKYPNSPYTRAAALQYVLTEEMFLTLVKDELTWSTIAEESGRAGQCIAQLRLGFQATQKLTAELRGLLLNTDARKNAFETAFKYTTSHGDASGIACDVQI